MSAEPDRAAALAADRAARTAAQRELDRPLVLEAGAGTGKTTTLVARVLAWCLGPGWDRARNALEERERGAGRAGGLAAAAVASRVLDRIVAITFTEAAAAEMAERVAVELAALAHPDADPADWLLAELPPPGERARRAGALLAVLDRLAVRTIHAFCRGLLADHPLEAGLHTQLTVDADGSRLAEVARETVEAALRRAYGEPGDAPPPAATTAGGVDGESPFVALAIRGVGPQELAEALTWLGQAGLPTGALDADPLAPERADRHRARLAAACRQLHALVAPGLPPRAADQLAGRAVAGLAAVAAAAEAGRPVGELVALARESFPDNVRDRLRAWRRGDWTKTVQAAVAGRETEVVAAAVRARAAIDHLCRLDPELLDLARRALAPLHDEVRRELTARGIVTFQDLLTAAARLLAERPDVAARVRAGIDQLLVDELQDTDRVQCEIVGRLALAGPEEARPVLFVVGDPKQSIYGWRNADLAAYDELVERVESAGGRRAALVENFRSVPAILGEVERLIAPVMRAERGLQPPFEPLVACRRLAGEAGFRAGGDAGGGPRRAAVEHWISWSRPEGPAGREGPGAEHPASRERPERPAARPAGPGAGGPRATSSSAATAVEAEAIARDLRQLHDRHGLAWRDAALLLRSTSDLDDYLEALRRHGVPFAVGRTKHYYRRREVVDAAALVRAVLDPGDHLALLTYLRSSMVGVPDAALLPLWNRGFPDRMTELAGDRPAAVRRVAELVEEAAAEVAAIDPAELPGIERVAGWESALLAGVEALAELRAAFRRQPADDFVESLRRATLVEPVEAARFLGVYRLANLDRFFRRLGAALDEGGDAAALLRELRRSVAEAREAEEAQPQSGAEDAVRVMTIHQAKGLDFAHVYLPQLHKETGGDRGPRETRVPSCPPADAPAHAQGTGASFEYLLLGAPTLDYDLVEAAQARVEAAERVRLLYVATTRAKVRLVLAGRWPDPAAPREAERARTFVDLACSRAGLGEGGPGSPRDVFSTGPAEVSFAAAWEAALAGSGPASWAGGDGVLWRFGALEAWPEPDEPAPDAVPLPAVSRVEADARDLACRRAAAAVRAGRPFAAAASEEAHARLRELAEEVAGAARAAVDGTDGSGREVAMAAGTAIHRALEELDPAADPAAELARLRARFPGWLAAAGPAVAEAALPEAEELLAALARGRLLARLRQLAPHVLARELPMLLAPEGDGGDATEPPDEPATGDGEAPHGDGEPGPPVGFVSGAIDLLYRDPETGEVVVVDYKTDRTADEAALTARAGLYASQGTAYARAVQRALGLAAPPRVELWFLRADRVVEVATAGPAAVELHPPPREARTARREPGERDLSADTAEPAEAPRPGEPADAADAAREPVQGTLFDL